MAKYTKIAVIYGSDTSESEISCRSGEFVASRIDGNEYDIYEIMARFGSWSLVSYKKRNSMRVTFPQGSRPEINKNDFSVKVLGETVKFDFAYIVQHGAPGENGQMPAYFEMLAIPHSTCSSFVSTIAFDKALCKCYLADKDIVKLAPGVCIHKGSDFTTAIQKINSTLKYPLFVKPTQAGSSFGVTRITDPKELVVAINFAFSEGSDVLVEQAIQGREITCSVYKDNQGVQALPLLEIVSENSFFDYEAKYNGHSQEICPAPISEVDTILVQKTAKEIYSNLNCKGLIRIDFILAASELYFLEINTIPGMTSASMVPKMIRTAGIDITDFLTQIIENQ